MSNSEGVIQFELEHTSKALDALPEIQGLISWHSILHKLGLVGQEPQRYGGYAFGNISQRSGKDRFIISATQTGGHRDLNADDFAEVLGCDVTNNRVRSQGVSKPSSECMTHAAIYEANTDIGAVVHSHSTLIWSNWSTLGTAVISENIEYGTPAMAKAVKECVNQSEHLTRGAIVMLGHEDGVITYANDLETAVLDMVRLLARSNSE